MAVAHGHSEIIPLLMKAGADPTIKGPKGKTATEIAQVRYKDQKGTFDPAMLPLLSGQTWEDFMFKFAQAKGTPEAYTEYLSAFPQGRHVNEAKDSRAFVQAQVQGTLEAYAEYIASYPSGRHVEEVRRLQAMRKKYPLLTATSPAGTAVRECAECPKMVVVPAGRFRMGDLSGAGGSGEKPVHDVTIASPFAVGKYEVTFAEWDACVAGGGCTHRPADDRWGRGTRPVIDVSWDDTQAYVRWLSRETGKPYRLLSEAEWEYVARAGTTTKYWWGNEADHAHANYGKDNFCEGMVAGADRWEYTSPVGSFAANAFGLFDTAGNVWEWVADCWHDSYQGAPNDGSVWAGGDCDRHELRGGSWADDPRRILSADRDRYSVVCHGSVSGFRGSNVGFRVARTLD